MSGASTAKRARTARATTLPWAAWGRRLALYLVLSVGAALMAFPFLWMLLSALKTRAEVTRVPPTFWPTSWRPANFVEAWQAAPFARYFLNSLIVSGLVAAGVAITSLLAAYAFARLRFPGRGLLFGLFLATLMVPFEATLIPNFLLVRDLRLYDTYLALIVPWLANVVGVFLLRQFLLTLPHELFEAAKLDGCGHLGTLRRVVLPLAWGPLGAVALFNFLAQWNSLLWPLLVIGRHQELRPIQLGLSVFLNQDANMPHLHMAAATFTIVPIIVLYFFVQRQFIEGIAASGVRG